MKRTISFLMAIVMLLSLTIALPRAAYAVGSGEKGVEDASFRYQHDPRLNPAAMADIVVDPKAVYGFSPSREGSLAAYADFDWSDPALVNGENGRLARVAYHESIAEMYRMLSEMRAAGKSVEEIARAVSTKRNELRLAAYADDPEGLAVAKERNRERYGHEEGPLPEELYAKYGSWEIVIDKAFSVNSGMDACLGLYDDYYELYVAAGQVKPESSASASREYTVAAFVDAAGLPLPKNDEALNAYQDAETISGWFRSELAAAVSAGILKGYSDNTLRPQATITRLEAFVLLSRCLPDLEANSKPLTFADVPAWAKKDIDRLSAAGIVKGYGNGLLGAGDLLTVAQTALLVQRVADLLSDSGELSLWTDAAPAKNALVSYMEAITDESSPDFIPVSDRIAVFDMDGTVFCETDPVYFDHMLFMYRVTQDPDYKDKASDVEKEIAEKIQKEFIENGTYPAGMDVAHGQGVASAFAGMTLGEFDAYVQAFKQLPMPSYTGMTQGEAFYRPMVQLIEYLQANDFKVYIVSGTDRLIVRALFKDNILDIPPSQLIGSDELIVASHQGDADGLDYTFVEGDELILGGEFLIKNLKMNKVTVIAQEIGQQPVLSFGNSSGDGAMANYVISGNPHRALAFMLCCDDTVRENGSQSKADKMYDLCNKNGWIPISMRDDWTTIYGDGVTYLGAAADALSGIKARGVLRVGATGDYRPMSFRDPETGEYWGFDAELAEDLAAALGVKLEYVPTTWPTLMADTLAGKFDLAICGITVTDARKEQALMSDGYLGNGKTVLCRTEDADKYISLDAINRPEVTVMENPGGLNEKFARENLPNATLVIHNVNEEIPGLVASGEADVMITEILEAGWYVGQDSRLAAPLIYEPFTQGQLGVLMPKGSEALLDYVNAFLASEKASGRIDALAREYIYQYIDGAADAAA